MYQIFNDKRLGIHNFWSLDIDAPTYYISQKHFTVTNRMARVLEFMIFSCRVLTHPSFTLVKNIFQKRKYLYNLIVQCITVWLATCLSVYQSVCLSGSFCYLLVYLASLFSCLACDMFVLHSFII